MSEYQLIKFRAIDRPLTDKQLEFMDHQSSRAAFTKWEFEVDYHFSSFRGDVDGMLRRGYDIFLMYSDYGSRQIRMRLPDGLPFPKSLWTKYFAAEELTWNADKSGKAGILSLETHLEGSNDHGMDIDDTLDATAKLREMIIAGDLRALYILWMCSTASSYFDDQDDATMEPPVPHGITNVSKQVTELLFFFDADPYLLDAVSCGIPDYDPHDTNTDLAEAWLKTTNDSRRKEVIRRLLSEDPVVLKAELIADVRSCRRVELWPVTPSFRTIAELRGKCEELRAMDLAKQKKQRDAIAKRNAEAAEKQRRERLKEMKTAPARWLKKATDLVEERTTNNYREAASILADVRDAIGGAKGSDLTRAHAAHLVTKYPTLRVLKSSLRKQGLLD